MDARHNPSVIDGPPGTATDRRQLRISCSVMTHPSRRAGGDRVLAAVSSLRPTLALDPDPTGPPSALRTAQIAWSQADPASTHHVVLQDDVVVSADFERRLIDVLTARPHDIIGLFCDWGSRTAQLARMAVWTGSSFAPIVNSSVTAVAIVMPTGLATEFAKYLLEQTTDRDSLAVATFAQEHGLAPLVCIPSLVEHDVTDLPRLWLGKIDQGPRRTVIAPPEQAPYYSDRVYDFPSYVAYVNVDRLAAFVHRIGPLEATDRWRAFDHPSGLCLPKEEMATRFSAAKTPSRLASLVAPHHLFQVWVASWTTGRILAGQPHLTLDLGGDLARGAAATTVYGSGRRLLPAQHIGEVADISADWVLSAVLDGYRFDPSRSA